MAEETRQPEAVMIVTPRWTRNGGVGTHARASAAALAELGIRVTVLAARADDHDGPAHVIVAERLFDRGADPATRVGEARDVHADIVHVHQADHPELVAYLREGAPLLVSAHGYSACPASVHYFRPGQECHRSHGPGCIANMLARGCSHGRSPAAWRVMYTRSLRALETLRHADLAVSYSSVVDRHLAENGLERRAVVPLFSTLPPSPERAPLPRRVLYAGRLVQPKGVDILVRAAARVDCQLVICGDGRELEPLQRRARTLGIEHRVTFTGWLDENGLAEQIADAAVVAIPSLWPEPFGLAGIEAFAAGRPVVASDTGGVRDWLTEGIDGLAVAPGDVAALAGALDRLLGDEALCERMGAAGRAGVGERFERSHHVRALLEAYAGATAVRAAAR